MLKKKKLSLLALFVILSISVSNAQNQVQDDSILQLYDFVDDVYGFDDKLINGVRYYSQNPDSRGHAYFKSKDFKIGSVTVRGAVFGNQQIKYNAEIDKLILSIQLSENLESSLILNDEFIDEFTIDGHRFVNSQNLPKGHNFSGFVELVHKRSFMFIIKYKKYYHVDGNSYTDIERQFYLFDNLTYTRVKSRRSFLQYYKLYKKEIRKFMRNNKLKFRKADVSEFRILMEFCENIKA